MMPAQYSPEVAEGPWTISPRFDIAMTSPIAGSEWSWRELDSYHPAISHRPEFLRLNDAEGAIELISEKYGDPTAYCVLGANVACVMGWRNLSFDEQYHAISRGAGAFPCGGMCYLSVTGPDAARTLDLLTPRSIDALEVGQATFVLFTTPEGTIDTEGIVLRDGPQSYQVSVGGDTRPPAWLYDALDQFQGAQAVEANVSSFNIKGPRRDAAMQRLLANEFVSAVTDLPVFRGVRVRTRFGADAWVLRTVIGIEMWATPEIIHDAWRCLLADSDHVTPCGWEVLATYRLECSDIAFYLCPLDINRSTYVYDAGLGHAISRGKKTPFVGRAALQQPECYGSTLWVAGLAATTSEAPRRTVGDPVYSELSGSAVGFVTTAGFSPTAVRQLCFAHLPKNVRPGCMVWFSDGTRWEVVALPILPKLAGSALP